MLRSWRVEGLHLTLCSKAPENENNEEKKNHNSKFTKDKMPSYCVRNEQGQSGTQQRPLLFRGGENGTTGDRQ